MGDYGAVAPPLEYFDKLQQAWVVLPAAAAGVEAGYNWLAGIGVGAAAGLGALFTGYSSSDAPAMFQGRSGLEPNTSYNPYYYDRRGRSFSTGGRQPPVNPGYPIEALRKEDKKEIDRQTGLAVGYIKRQNIHYPILFDKFGKPRVKKVSRDVVLERTDGLGLFDSGFSVKRAKRFRYRNVPTQSTNYRRSGFFVSRRGKPVLI